MRATAVFGEIMALGHIGEYPRARALLRACIEDPSYGDGKSLARLHHAGAQSHFFEGDLPGSIWYAESARKLAMQHHMPMTQGWVLAFLGAAHWNRNELPEAERLFRAVFERRFTANQHAVSASMYYLLNILVERGAFDEAQTMTQVIHEMEAAMTHSNAMRIAHALDAYVACRRGDLQAAMAWANTSPLGISRKADANYPDAAILTHILLAEGAPASLARAQHIASQALATSQFLNDHRSHHEALVWQARVKYLQGFNDEALDTLAIAVAFAQPRRIVRWFVDGGEPVRQMLAQLARSHQCADQANAILVAAWPANHAAQQSPDQARAALLTYREIEVLELMAEKLTNKEIASRLHISPITVRNHTSSIYEKLRVATRREAVLQAKSLRLIV